jgi:hypothetical protein
MIDSLCTTLEYGGLVLSLYAIKAAALLPDGMRLQELSAMSEGELAYHNKKEKVFFFLPTPVDVLWLGYEGMKERLEHRLR